MWNLELTWPHLERLELSNLRDLSLDRPTGCFGSSVFAMLPRTLKWFGFYYAFTYECLADLSSLPKGLQTLRLPDNAINIPGLRTLPKSITDLRYSVESDDAITLLLKKPSILPNLKEFPFNWEEDECSSWRDDVYEGDYSWPKNISSMTHRDVDEDTAFANLPPKLTSLDFQSIDVFPTLAAEHLVGLPRYLTSLEVYSVNWEAMESKDWPSSLTKLRLDFPSNFGAYCFRYLPRSLKEFEIINSDEPDEQADPEISRLCNDAAALQAFGIDSLSLDEELWNTEKQQLLAAGRKTYVEKVEAGGLYGLPLTLKKLQLGWLMYPMTQKLLMPPHMHEIGGPALKYRLDDSTLFGAFDHHPPGSLEVMVLPPTEPITPSVSALYLSNLVSLTVQFDGSTIDRPFQYLPRGLRCLKLIAILHPSKYTKCHVTDLDDLPQQLESFTLGLSVVQFFWTSHLPRTLKYLSTSETPILGDDIEHLPPCLESIQTSIVSATVSQYRQLPRSIRTWTIPEYQKTHSPEYQRLTSTYKPLWRMWESSESEMTLALANPPI